MLGMTPESSRSAPEQNPSPAPVITTTRVSLSWLTSSSASRNGIITSNAMAFIRSGRLRVMQRHVRPGPLDQDEWQGLPLGVCAIGKRAAWHGFAAAAKRAMMTPWLHSARSKSRPFPSNRSES